MTNIISHQLFFLNQSPCPLQRLTEHPDGRKNKAQHITRSPQYQFAKETVPQAAEHGLRYTALYPIAVQKTPQHCSWNTWHAAHSRDDVEVPEEARGDGVSSTAGRTTRANKHHVDDLPELQCLAVIPGDDDDDFASFRR